MRVGETAQIPDIQSFRYLLDIFFEVGPARSLEMGGFAPLSWVDLNAFNHATKSDLDRWEMYLVIQMSKAYCMEKNGGDDPFRIPPMEREEDER